MTVKLTKNDVLGAFGTDGIYTSKGLVLAVSDEVCPVWKDVLPFKSVTVGCSFEELEDVQYWLEYVYGSITNIISLFGRFYLRAKWVTA